MKYLTILIESNENIVVVVNKTDPITQIIPSTSNGAPTVLFNVAVRRLVERNTQGEEVSSIELDSTLNFTYSERHFSNASKNLMWEYTSLLDNQASVDIVVSYILNITTE